MRQTLQVQVAFTEDTAFGKFADAIYYPYDDFGHVRQEDIDKEAQARIDAYIASAKVRNQGRADSRLGILRRRTL